MENLFVRDLPAEIQNVIIKQLGYGILDFSDVKDLPAKELLGSINWKKCTNGERLVYANFMFTPDTVFCYPSHPDLGNRVVTYRGLANDIPGDIFDKGNSCLIYKAESGTWATIIGASLQAYQDSLIKIGDKVEYTLSKTIPAKVLAINGDFAWVLPEGKKKGAIVLLSQLKKIEADPDARIKKIAKRIFKEHWSKVTSLRFDSVVEQNMQYAIDAIVEALKTEVKK